MSHKDPIKRREHHRKYMKNVWYPKNKQKHISYLNNLKRKILLYINNVKNFGFCADCGYVGKEHPEVLDFDHTKDKSFNIGNCLRYTVSLDRVKEEIKKCELVCANCHRIRTVNRRNKKLV